MPAVVPLISTANVESVDKVKSPLMVNVPAPETPGESIPPEFTVNVYSEFGVIIEPVPPNVAPESTVTAEVSASEPVTDNVPTETVVLPA